MRKFFGVIVISLIAALGVFGSAAAEDNSEALLIGLIMASELDGTIGCGALTDYFQEMGGMCFTLGGSVNDDILKSLVQRFVRSVSDLSWVTAWAVEGPVYGRILESDSGNHIFVLVFSDGYVGVTSPSGYL